jgi:hypothetical protein
MYNMLYYYHDIMIGRMVLSGTRTNGEEKRRNAELQEYCYLADAKND